MTTLLSDTFTGTDGTAWAGANWTTGQTATGGAATIQSNTGRLKAGTTAYAGRTSRRANITAPTNVDFSGTFVHDGGECFPTLWARADTALDTQNGYVLGWLPPGAGSTVTLQRADNYTRTTLGSASKTLAASTTYGFRFQVIGSNIKARIWNGTEPSTWDIEVTDSGIASAGAVGFSVSAGAAGGEYFTVDDVVITDGAGGSGANVLLTDTFTSTGGGGQGGSGNRSTLPWQNGVFGNESGAAATAKFDAFQSMSGKLLDFVDQHPGWAGISPGLDGGWWYTPHQGRGYNICVSVPLYGPDGVTVNHAAYFGAAAQALVNAGWTKAIWRIGVEFNLNNSWKATDSNYTTWMTRFRQASQAVKAAMPGARIAICMNEGNSQSCSNTTTDAIVNGLADAYDIIAPDYYDQWEPIYNTTQGAARFGSTSTFGTMNYWLGRARALGKKFGLGEWGVAQGSQWAGHQGGDNAFYIQYLMDWVAANAADVEYIAYFEEDASYLKSDITTTATNPNARAAYIAKVAQYAGTGGGGSGVQPWSSNWTTGLTATGGGAAVIEGNAGKLVTGNQGGYAGASRTSRRANITTPADVDITGKFWFDTTECYAAVGVRADTALDTQNGYYFFLDKSGTLALKKAVGYTTTTLGSAVSFTVAAGTRYGFRLQAIGTTIKAKVWPSTSAEPAAWDVTATDATFTTAGAVGLTVVGGAAAVNSAFFVDDIVITSDGASVPDPEEPPPDPGTPPPPGTVAITATEQDVYPPRVQVVVTGLVPGNTISLYRQQGAARTLLRAADDVTTGDAAFVRVDAELPFGVPVTYVAVVNGTLTYETAPVTHLLPGGKVAVSDALNGNSAEVVILAWPERSCERPSTLFVVGGRNVVVSGLMGGHLGQVTLFTETETAMTNLRQVLAEASHGLLQVRQPGGYAGIDGHYAVTGYTERRWSQDGSDPRRTWDLDLVETEPWPDAFEAPGWTLADLAEVYSGRTLNDLGTDFTGQTLLQLATADLSS